MIGNAFVAGLVAGYAVAVPVGAIAILIVELGLRRGFRDAAAAGAGAATVDFLYATVAMVAGGAVRDLIGPIQPALRLAAALTLVGVAVRGIVRSLRPADVAVQSSTGSAGTIYLRFVGLTLLNPATVIYFGALALGLGAFTSGFAERAAFVAGAFVASLSWQTFLAALGSLGHRRLPPGARQALGVLGSVVIIALAVAIATGTA